MDDGDGGGTEDFWMWGAYDEPGDPTVFDDWSQTLPQASGGQTQSFETQQTYDFNASVDPSANQMMYPACNDSSTNSAYHNSAYVLHQAVDLITGFEQVARDDSSGTGNSQSQIDNTL